MVSEFNGTKRRIDEPKILVPPKSQYIYDLHAAIGALNAISGWIEPYCEGATEIEEAHTAIEDALIGLETQLARDTEPT